MPCGSAEGPGPGRRTTGDDAFDDAVDDAFIDAGVRRPGAPGGPLNGTTFAVKDIFDVANRVACCGCPDWGRDHDPAPADAPVITRLLDAGATLSGVTHMAEMAWSLIGSNHHYGMPANPAAPGRIPGGSSSGSAVAVAAGRVDFALGTDTGGSVRVPAGFCGIFGLRPSHGRIPLQGLMELAGSFDSIGWFARDADLLRRVGQVLLQGENTETVNTASGDGAWQDSATLLYPVDVWNSVAEPVRAALAPACARLEADYGSMRRITLAPDADADADAPTRWANAFRIIQGWEAWRRHGAWIEARQPRFGPDIAGRFAWAASISAAEKAAADAERAALTEHLRQLLAGDGLLVLPVAPGPPPTLRQVEAEGDAWRGAMLRLTGIAPLARLPQITVPAARLDGLPLGLSLMCWRGQDERLIDLACRHFACY